MSYSHLKKLCTSEPIPVSDATIQATNQPMSTASPSVFGPHIWAYLHISTAHLPENLNPAVAQQVKNTIAAIPVMLPCESCSIHSGNFMTSNRDRLMGLTTGSDFFKFTVDFHNFVNNRLGKRTISLNEAIAMWK